MRTIEPVNLDRRWPAQSFVVIGVLVAALLASLLWGLSERNARDSASSRHAAVAAVSGQIVAAMTTYDYTGMDATEQRVLALATGTFAQQYRDGFGALKDLAQQVQSRSSGTVKTVYVGDLSPQSATTLVDVDLVTSGANRVTRIGYYFTLSLLNVGGAWKVDNIVTLPYNPSAPGSAPGSGSASGATPGPPASAPTTGGSTSTPTTSK